MLFRVLRKVNERVAKPMFMLFRVLRKVNERVAKPMLTNEDMRAAAGVSHRLEARACLESRPRISEAPADLKGQPCMGSQHW
eukprot:scaffold12667_cov108-Cylindrotheca_fusiformis.AAC.2